MQMQKIIHAFCNTLKYSAAVARSNFNYTRVKDSTNIFWYLRFVNFIFVKPSGPRMTLLAYVILAWKSRHILSHFLKLSLRSNLRIGTAMIHLAIHTFVLLSFKRTINLFFQIHDS